MSPARSGRGTVAGLDWRSTVHRSRLAVLAGLGLVLPVLVHRPVVGLLAAPPLVLLVAGRPRRLLPGRLQVRTWELDRTRAVEGDEVEVRAVLAVPSRAPVTLAWELVAGDGTSIASGPAAGAVDGRRVVELTWRVRLDRWGRREAATLRVEVSAPDRQHAARLVLRPLRLDVLPDPSRADAAVPAVRTRRRAGQHVSRTAGPGLELAGIRPWAAGDRVRDISWRVSARRGSPYVVERAREADTDVVVVLDCLQHRGPVASESLALAVRGASALARAHLRVGDRVGVVAYGGTLRWVRPQSGSRQHLRIAEAALDVLDDVDDDIQVDPDPDRLPRISVPAGAAVVVLSPLVDTRVIHLVATLRSRGHAVAVVDCLAAEPPLGRGRRGRVPPVAALALRAWRLEREVVADRLRGHGVLVTRWDGSGPIDAALAPLRRAGRAGAVR